MQSLENTLLDSIDSSLRVCVVGAGTRFLSGISYYTILLSNALTDTCDVSTILMRQLLPTRLYPGRQRVGAQLTKFCFRPEVRFYDGVDWFWLPSIIWALRFLLKESPDILVFQWWTGTVLHSYIALAVFAKILGTRVIIEFHEILDTGEARVLFAQYYVNVISPILMYMSDGFIIHSEFDRPALEKCYRISGKPVTIIPLGSFDQYQVSEDAKTHRVAPDSCCNLLFFGAIRPYKGLEDLVQAFNNLSEEEVDKYWLTVVGETWEDWDLPLKLIENSSYRNRITLVNRYVSDEEVASFFAEADAVILPYHRSSASGPIHIAMSWGLPIVTTSVGGLVEAVTNYEGVILVKPHDISSLHVALRQVATLRGRRYSEPHSWEELISRFGSFFTILMAGDIRNGISSK